MYACVCKSHELRVSKFSIETVTSTHHKNSPSDSKSTDFSDALLSESNPPCQRWRNKLCEVQKASAASRSHPKERTNASVKKITLKEICGTQTSSDGSFVIFNFFSLNSLLWRIGLNLAPPDFCTPGSTLADPGFQWGRGAKWKTRIWKVLRSETAVHSTA